MQLVGETLGKYRISEHLGSGGMSEVYKAYQPGLDRYVAIKVLHSFLAAEEDFLTRFQREAKVAAMLRHPNVIQVYDFDYDAEHNAYYMVMEFIDGPTLKMRLQEMAQKGQMLSLEEAVRVVTAIANALDYAHQHGMVHRDVKPANIMFTRDDQPILTDFGIAKMVNVIGVTASGAMVGTPAYMSPEQGMGQAGDERADIYSLGVVLYQLATGRLPFDADTPLGVAIKHINAPLPLPTVINPNLPPGIEAVILHALAKDPARRYQTAREFATELKQAIAGQPVEPVPLELVAAPTTPLPTSVALPQDQGKQWEMATMPTAPVYVPPAAGTSSTGILLTLPERRWITAAIVIGALILVGGCMALFATGTAERWLATLARAIATPTPTPTVFGTPAPTSTPDLTATYGAEATQFAIWIATYVATAGVTPTPSPTPTPTPDLTATALAACVFDMAVTDDPPVSPAALGPGQEFAKRWAIKNTGTCAWPEGVHVVFKSGDELVVVAEPEIGALSPGETAQIVLYLQAPADYANYTSVWELQDSTEHSIGPGLKVTFQVAPTPTPRPRPTATPTPTSIPPSPTPAYTLTPTEPLWMSIPGFSECDKDRTRGVVAWGYGGGPSSEHRFFYGRVAPEFELEASNQEIRFPSAPQTYYTTSGPLVWPIPDNCCGGVYGRYVSPQGYEIVWQQATNNPATCPQ